MECRPHVVVQYSAEHNSGSSEPFSVWHLCSAVVRCARVAACCCAYTLRPITLAPGQSHLVAQASTNLPSQHHQCRIAIGDIPPQVTPSFNTRVATGGAIVIRAKNQGQDLGLDDHKKFEGFAETTIGTIDSADVTGSYRKYGAIGSIPCS